MLAEGFLRVLRYREERKFASASKLNRSQIRADYTDVIGPESDLTDLQTDSAEADLSQEELDSIQELKAMPQDHVGLTIPGCSPVLHLDPAFFDDCSLLEKYPDLHVADSSRISNNPLRVVVTQHGLAPEVACQPEWAARQEPQGRTDVSSIPDQGYLVMGSSVNISMDLPGSGLEPVSNSVLNGMLDKEFNQLYMQHLIDSLAQCNSQQDNSILHGLVPPPQPSSQMQGLDSLDASLEVASGGDSDKKISYLNTQNTVPYSSNFSSPVLRISEADNTPVQ